LKVYPIQNFLVRRIKNVAQKLVEHPEPVIKIRCLKSGIAELFARYKPQGARLYFAAHKNILKARELAGQSQGHALALKDLPELLLKADVLVSATSSPHRIFSKDYFSRIAALRERELHIYDLALPRAVDPEAKNIDGIVLNNIDDLSGIFEKHNRSLEAILNEPNLKNRYAVEPAGY